jgi:S-DNA-T family DNA segregation ATPase FtsK/SpoIIIE
MFNFSLSFARSFVGRRFQRQQSLFPEEEKIISESLKVNGSLVPDGKENEEMKKNGTGEKSGKTELDNDTEEYEEAEEKMIKARNRFKKNGFEMPPLDLLESDKGKPSTGDIKANANIIKRTLQTFGISVEMNEICVGPSVTQYTLKPAEGVKLTRITGLNNDLSLALAAHPIRIEAPIPGKSLVGIEVPNRVSSLVGLRGLFGDEEYKNSDLPLLVCLGRNVAGRPVYSSVSKMPHLLIAGTTGSGKSVSIHTLITSLLYRHAPWELQFIMIDAKRVELTVYNDIPYLLTPVVTEAKKAIQILKWATGEMERRYNRLLEVGARDIHSYHEKQTDSPMPYIVIVIDELADLMATYPRELEAAVVRLAQMSRAVGIHLILSTQRPSVEVITGLIKANIGTRIAFRVPQLVDSRTILDMSGAEKLLGNGDMLFMSGESGKPRRIQGAFIGEKEVKKVVNYIKNIYADLEMEGVNFGGEIEQASMFKDSDIDDGEDDGVYEQAREIVIKDQKASTSYLQRRLKLGYSRAARIMDLLQERGVVGPQDGSKAREVLIKDESGEF